MRRLPERTGGSGRIERRAQPFDFVLDQHDVEAARRRRGRKAHQIVARCEHDAAPLGRADARRCAAMARAAAPSHLDEHERAVGLAHDEIDLAAAAPRRSVIACDQPQPGRLQMCERAVFGRVAGLLRRRPRVLRSESGFRGKRH